MANPTQITCSVSADEFCRYESGKDTVYVTVEAQGGAPYTNTAVYVELRKARRARDTSVASASYVLSGSADPQTSVIAFDLNAAVDQDLINLVRHGKYFVRAYCPAEAATANIGTTLNNNIRIVAPSGAAFNTYQVQVVVPSGNNPLSVSFSGGMITISLATIGGVPVAADNTALLVVNAINNYYVTYGFLANVTGTGQDSFSAAISPVTFAGGEDEVHGDSPDFDIRMISVERFRREWLFGIDLSSTEILAPLQQPTVEGIDIIKVSKGHKKGMGLLSYETHEDVTATASINIGSGAQGTVTIKAQGAYAGSLGNGIIVNVVVPTGTSPLSVSFGSRTLTISLDVIAGVPNNVANTAVLVAAAINAFNPDFVATFSGVGSGSLTAASSGVMSGGLTVRVRTATWKGGPVISLKNAGTYILPAGTTTGPAASLIPAASQVSEYIQIRVHSPLLLPNESYSEYIMIDNMAMDDSTLARFLDEAISYVENDFLNVYLEPTVVVTDRDPTTIQFVAEMNNVSPMFAGDNDYDYIVNPLTYFTPHESSSWVKIQTPFPRLLRVDSLFGAIANTRVIDIDLQWVEHSGPGGLLQLVPFNQQFSFNFIGLLWSNAIRGAIELPNFWHFNMVVGLRDCPPDLLEYVGKYAAINALTMAGLAFRPGLGSVSLSRDGVSESVSYNTAQNFGAFGPTIASFKEWQDKVEPKLRAKYRGLTMVVV